MWLFAFMEESRFGRLTEASEQGWNCPQILGYLVQDIPSDVSYPLAREV